MMAFFKPETAANSDQVMRVALAPLAALAARSGASVLLVRPLTKRGGRKALYRGGGSIGIIGAIRTALFLGRDPREPDRARRTNGCWRRWRVGRGRRRNFRKRRGRRGMASGRWSGPSGASAWSPGVCGRTAGRSGNGPIRPCRTAPDDADEGKAARPP
jgi:hypothetical protein